MKLIIDIGNTRVKVAVFQGDDLLSKRTFDKEEILKKINQLLEEFEINEGIISSVGRISSNDLQKLKENIPCLLILNHQVRLPFLNLYATPSSLGVDRLAHAAAAVYKFSGKNVLVIDSGTCLTFDFITKENKYLGGAISLGLQLRFKALHSFTANLPKLDPVILTQYIGDNTESSIHSGVINGMVQEIIGVIKQYQHDFKDLTVVLTGGDANFLAKQLKNGIFVAPNLVLEGLYTILTYNSANE